MFYSRTLNHRIIIRIHERALRIAYDDYLLDFEELLVKDNTVRIYKHNLRTLEIEMYKISNNLSPLFTRDMMTEICVPYITRSTTRVEEDGSGSFQCTKKSNYEIPRTKRVSYGF